MSTVTRRKRISRFEIGAYRRHELLTGEIKYPVQGYTGYGDGVATELTKFISDEMRNDWERNREALMMRERQRSRRLLELLTADDQREVPTRMPAGARKPILKKIN